MTAEISGPNPRARFEKGSPSHDRRPTAVGRARVQPPARAIGIARIPDLNELYGDFARETGIALTPQQKELLKNGQTSLAAIREDILRQRGHSSLFGLPLPRHPVDPTEIV